MAVTHKIVFGEPMSINAQLEASAASTAINTSFVERENLTLRQQNRRLTRKTNGLPSPRRSSAAQSRRCGE